MEFAILFSHEWFYAVPEVYLLFAGLVLLVFGAFIDKSADQMQKQVVLSLVLGLILVLHIPSVWSEFCFSSLIIDPMAVRLKLLLIAASLGVFFLSFEYVRHPRWVGGFEHPLLMLLAIVGMMVLLSAHDFLTLYLGLEFQSLALYCLAAQNVKDRGSAEAGTKYFILGALASGLLLLGISLVYGFTGSTHFGQIADFVNLAYMGSLSDLSFQAQGMGVGMLLILIAFLFKIGGAPFHMWVPDVYAGSPTNVTAFFVVVPKIALSGVFVRLVYEVFVPLMPVWQEIFVVCGLLGIFVGALGALGQTRLVRIVAFSGIGHVGFLLLALGSGTVEGLSAFFFYLPMYVLMNLVVFSVLLNSIPGQGELRHLKQLTLVSPLLAGILMLAIFSLAGVPPLGGFFAKLFVLSAVMNMGSYFVALVAVIISVASCFFYLRLIVNSQFKTPTQEESASLLAASSDEKVIPFKGLSESIVASSSSLVLVGFLLLPGPLLAYAESLALSVL